MKNLLSKLTLVIPTYNRQSYALRNMRYWSGQGATVLIIDGSDSPIPTDDLAGFSDNIYYHYLPVSMYDRLKYSLELIETDYCALMGDDEFFLPSALQNCINELDTCIELVSCIGRCMGFGVSLSGVTGFIEYPLMESYSIMQDDSIDRMLAHMDPYVPSTIYSVVRTHVWKRAINVLVKREFSAFAIGELQFELAVCCQGKSKVIPELMWLRSNESPGIRGTDESLKPEKTFIGWWRNSALKMERAEFLSIMGKGLANKDNKDNEIALGVKKALDIYVKSRLSKLNRFQRVKYEISKHLSPLFRIALKKIIINFNNRFSTQPKTSLEVGEERLLMEVSRDLESAGVKIDYDELSNIELTISNFHANKRE